MLAGIKTQTGSWILSIGLVTVFGSLTFAQDRRIEFFEKQIRPILANHCYECHGPEKQESDLRVDHRSFLTKDGEYGKVLIPGKPSASSLYFSLTHEDDDLAMPFERQKLDASVLANFKKWIDDGAVWPKEPVPDGATEKFDIQQRKKRLPWIWQTPVKQVVPTPVKQNWARSDIDRFILDKLEKNKLAAAADAEPEVWLRRVHFAITGLPPQPQQIQDFLADPSDEQREKIVDQLLASPHFGERWARHWMDLVRYAESRGHESDFPIANAWHYRDYLIRALNEDLPYDQFVKEHVAGDLLTHPRLNKQSGYNESVLATGWPFFGEEVHSPVDIRQDECERIDNKVDVFSKSFLGLTVACARCHDHKFDAISQKDYYALSGFILSSHFRQVRFESMQQNQLVSNELQKLDDSTQMKMAKAISTELKSGLPEAIKYLRAASRELAGEKFDLTGLKLDADRLAEWKTAIKSAAADRTSPLRTLYQALPQVGRTHTSKKKHQVIVDYADPQQPWLTSGPAFSQSACKAGDLILPTMNSSDPIQVCIQGAARRDAIWNGLKTRPGNEKDSGSLDAVGRSSGLLCTQTFELKDGRLHILMRGESRVFASVDSHLMITGPLHGSLMVTLKAPTKKWLSIDLTAYRGHRVHLEFGPHGKAPLEIWKVVEGEPPQEPAVVERKRLKPELEKAIAELEARLQRSIQSFGSRTIANDSHAERQAQDIQWMLTHLSMIDRQQELRSKVKVLIAKYESQRNQVAKRIVVESRTAISWMPGTAVDERVLARGSYHRAGSVANRRLPAAFSCAGPVRDSGSGRLQLADQMIDPQNPLVARVMVNRIWHHLMGRGIVETVDNFGWLGRRPTHPELLDHLAVQFVQDDKWSIKRMIKRIVLTRTYSMSSRPDDQIAERIDPNNQWLHRMSVRRLDAEIIRDNVLAVSGRLNPKVYGPPIPVHLTEFVIGRGRPGTSGPLDGNGRRSIYTSVRRNFLPTMMLTFDMPIPFSTVGRRTVTNVPAQSLAMMNDKFVYQQAKLWADQLLKKSAQSSPKDRIGQMYWQAIGRRASQAEINTALETLELLAEHHQVSPDDVQVWADLCHTFFQLNEFIYLR